MTGYPRRLLVLMAIAVALAAMMIVRWISGWGLVTLHEKDAPLGRILASVARQGGIRIECSLDPERRISIDVDRVPPFEAIDTLAIRTDATWRIVYLIAPTKEAIRRSQGSLLEGGKMEGWNTCFHPLGPLTGGNGGSLDPRRMVWKAEGNPGDPTAQTLPKLVDEAAQKTGAMILFPKNWTPPVVSLPKAAPVGKALSRLASSLHGHAEELFFITQSTRRYGAGEERPVSAGGFAAMDPRWLDERMQAQFALLPPAEQAAARKEYEERKALFAQLRDLPPEERMAKLRQLMADPDVAVRLQDRRLLREAKMTPEQRISRAVSYLERKGSMKGGAPAGKSQQPSR
jgi:hypothetical protein